MTAALPQPRTIRDAAVAGLLAGALMLVGLAALNAAFVHEPQFSVPGQLQFGASVLVGKVATTHPAYVALGGLLHFAVAVGWAIGYAAAAERERQLLTRPILSGAAFGIVVYFCMRVLVIAASLYTLPSVAGLLSEVFVHVCLYGIPVALVLSRLQAGARRSA